MEEKKEYEEPSVTKVEFEFNEAITASICAAETSFSVLDGCFD